jgi:hypothetical protein
MQYNSDESPESNPFASLQSSLNKDDFSTRQRKDITLTPSNLKFNMTEPEASKYSKTKPRPSDHGEGKSDQSVRQKTSKSTSESNIKTLFSKEREAEIANETQKAAMEFPNPMDTTLKGISFADVEYNKH